MPSLRARLVRAGLVTTLAAMRRAGVGQPDPDGPEEELAEIALEMREQFERMAELLPSRSWVTVGEADGPVPASWSIAERAERGRVVLHLHGGGYMMGSSKTHRGMTALLSRVTRAHVLCPDYRLAPEHTHPAALDDAVAAYRWLLDDRDVDPAKLAVTGDSAGGGLALSMLVRARDDGLPMPSCYVGLSPWTDLAGTGESLRTHDERDPWLSADMIPAAARGYAGDTPVDDPLVSPLYADLKGLPPMLLHVGEDEILRDDAVRLVERAREAGVDASVGVFEGMWHVFHAFPTPESSRAWREIGAFVRRHSGWVS